MKISTPPLQQHSHRDCLLKPRVQLTDHVTDPEVGLSGPGGRGGGGGSHVRDLMKARGWEHSVVMYNKADSRGTKVKYDDDDNR